jgi:hypothetical protein
MKKAVTPAKAEVHDHRAESMDSGFRRNDEKSTASAFVPTISAKRIHAVDGANSARDCLVALRAPRDDSERLDLARAGVLPAPRHTAKGAGPPG